MVPNKPRMTTIICRKFPRMGAHWKPRKSKICLSSAESSCSAQRQMREQRPEQQPMVPAASERRAPPEIRVVPRRRLPTPEWPPPGAGPARPRLARPAAAARCSRGQARAPPLLVSRAGRGQCGALDSSVCRGSL